jgi:hypothetical protein
MSDEAVGPESGRCFFERAPNNVNYCDDAKFAHNRRKPNVRALFRPSGRHFGSAVDHPRAVGIASPARSRAGTSRRSGAAQQLTSHDSTGKGIPMYTTIQLLAAASLIVASAAQAQARERALLSRVRPGYSIAATFTPTGSARVNATHTPVAGERALLGQVDSHARPTDPAGFTDAPIDGARALLGKWPSAISVAPEGKAGRSPFRADVRADVAIDATGDADFGAVQAGDRPSSVFVVSLGARGSSDPSGSVKPG